MGHLAREAVTWPTISLARVKQILLNMAIEAVTDSTQDADLHAHQSRCVAERGSGQTSPCRWRHLADMLCHAVWVSPRRSETLDGLGCASNDSRC